jgi:hypothetical protein
VRLRARVLLPAPSIPSIVIRRPGGMPATLPMGGPQRPSGGRL